ncbi:unnamed protein product [Medioppia subpectinata]|uniref:Uncharacterized protein n=1 Tax=Medioppia subpectinata TaxID=1979941 RepID=A0A7R9L273_9ACAR|nr:unnamed protein product [Medioppia subpectinata]CAG2114162.1 unnamed protein product [Medioppia subpectinata]
MFYISNKYLLNIFILSIIYAPNLSEQQTPNPNVIPREPDYCLQQRTNVFDENHGECGEEYSHLNTNNFCSQIECEPIIDCNSMDNENKVVMENITGRGCCPACVTYLEEFADCEVGSVLDRCRNGLFCNPSTKQCNTPGLDPSKDKCLIEYHNRIHGSSKQLRFYIESSKGETKYFAIKYRKDLGDMPGCDDETGQYQLKQCKQEK